MSPLAIALLGRKDEPTDAVEEYCRYLASALQPYDIQLEIRRVPWEIHGWHESLHALDLMATQWCGTWVLVQYTALAWSARGFPRRVLRVMRLLKSAGAKVAVIFHDVEPYPGSRLIDVLRRFVQIRVMRQILAISDLAISTVAPEKLSWLPGNAPRPAFIPVGANLPIPHASTSEFMPDSVPTIGVFSITGGDSGIRETQLILDAVRFAAGKIGKLRILVFGRHAELREGLLRQGLLDQPVELSVEGLVDPEIVVRRFLVCHVSLFVRGGISSRRGSAVAGIACGLPVIAFSGTETASPITDAGVILIPPDQTDQLNEALVRVLSDPSLQNQLATRSRAAYDEHFSWPAIALRFASLLRPQPPTTRYH